MIFLSCSSVSGANWNKHSTVNVGGWTLLEMPSSDNLSLMVHILSFQKTNKLELVLTAEMLSTSGRTAEETSLPRNLFNTVHFLLIRGGFIQFRLNVFSLRPLYLACALFFSPVYRSACELPIHSWEKLSPHDVFPFLPSGLPSCTTPSPAKQQRVSWFQENAYQEDRRVSH